MGRGTWTARRCRGSLNSVPQLSKAGRPAILARGSPGGFRLPPLARHVQAALKPLYALRRAVQVGCHGALGTHAAGCARGGHHWRGAMMQP